MSLTARCVLVVIVAYLLGSLNFSIIVSKLLLKKDIRDYGSGNAGTTNSYRVMGGTKASLVILGDMIKGFAAIALVTPIIGDQPSLADFVEVMAGMAAVLGHAFPVFFGFRGGKGVLTTAAVVLCIDWKVCVIAIALFVIIVAITRYVSLGSMIAVGSAFVWFYLFYGFTPKGLMYIIFGLVLALLVVVLHIPNIKRLASGTENKFKFKRKDT